jgi:hypothetical protein
MPSMRAPSEPRNRHRSWTCGSHAALPITVVPGVSTAAMTTFSVAMTLASSRKIDAPRSASARMSYPPFSSTSAPRARSACTCGSRRRRPITSPPGGGTFTAPERTRSGPARRNDARIRLQSSASSWVFRSSAAWTRTSFGPIQSTSAPRSARSASIVSTSRMRGTFTSSTGSSVRTDAARIGSAPFLFPAARTVPSSGTPPSMTKDSVTASAARVCGTAVP